MMFYKCDSGIKIYMRRQPHFQPPPGFSLINKDKRFFTQSIKGGIPITATDFTLSSELRQKKSIIKFYSHCKKQLNFSFFI